MHYYHVYNRGAHKQNIFENKKDMLRFLDGLAFFNCQQSRGDMSQTLLSNRRNQENQIPLATIHAYCLLPNHFHLLVSCEKTKHLSKFMQKLGTGYTNYYNEQYHDHSGTIFQGTYKKVLIESESQLYQVIAYINKNYELHRIDSANIISSEHEYFDPHDHIINDNALVRDNFIDQKQFKKFCKEKINETKRARMQEKLYHLID